MPENYLHIPLGLLYKFPVPNHDSESLSKGISRLFLKSENSDALNPITIPYDIMLKVTLDTAKH